MNAFSITYTAHILKEAEGAIRPWMSPDAVTMRTLVIDDFIDNQRQIEKCLACPKKRCTNCMRSRKNNYVSKKKLAHQPCSAEG